MSGTTVRIGLIGSGFLAETRARCYRRVHGMRAELFAVAARGGPRARAFAERHGIPHVAAGADALLAMPEVDLVDLCVPNALHRPLAEAAARAGKAVVCTKPLTAYVGQDLPPEAGDAMVAEVDRARMLAVAMADADAMVQACARAGVPLCYGENWVYAPAIRRARELAAAAGGVALELRGGEQHSGSHSPFSRSWRHAGGGALLRLGAHPLGAILHWKRHEGLRLHGRPTRAVAVSGEVADLSGARGLVAANTRIATGWAPVENWGCAILHFDDGTRALAWGSDNVLGGMESRLTVHGSNCHFTCDLSPSSMLRAYASSDRTFGDEYLLEKLDTQAGWSTPMPDEDWTSGHQAMAQAFCEAVARRETPESDGALGREVVRVLYAAYQSAAEGRRVEIAGG